MGTGTVYTKTQDDTLLGGKAATGTTVLIPTAKLATTAALPSCTYANGTAGVGATLTGTANGALTVDSVVTALNDRVLVKNQASGFQNGPYTLTQLGDGSHPFILTRATDCDSAAEIPGKQFYIQAGTVNAGFTFSVQGAGPFTMGTTGITFGATGSVLADQGGTASLDANGHQPYGQLPVGVAIFIQFNGTDWVDYAGNILTVSPTSRADVLLFAVSDSSGAIPSFIRSGDIVAAAL